ncbi:cytochrome P450 [Obba rivulosa]|uniref:Cytochrome P450 n=1 Tax=Obba rivulosa TaxID=1052685 RepID=A0A8E2DGD3_9APHY|nr:cytochrome P450 [Obba rivulosa]
MTPSFLGIIFSFAIIAALIVICKALQVLIRPILSPLRYVPGPPNPSIIYGHSKEFAKVGFTDLMMAWVERYGHVCHYEVFFNNEHFVTTDTRALHHILTHGDIFGKSGRTSPLLGRGLLVTEGQARSTKPRHVMNPAFGPAQIRELTSIFVEKSLQLRDIWMSKVEQNGRSARIDAVDGLGKMTLDVIGLSGFNYEFDSLNPDGKPNELNEAFNVIFREGKEKRTFLSLLEMYIPQLRRFANMAQDIPENQRMSDEDILAQVPTFLAAGHESTSTATTWCLYALTQAPEVQRKLREELLGVPTDTPTMDELNALPYLDAVITESLRVHSPVPQTARVAKKSDVIPLGRPFVDSQGQVQHSVKVRKGTFVIIPVMAVNKCKEIWGDDAEVFRPERWEEKTPDGAASVPSVWKHIFTFLGGPRACIGYRFALIEMKAVIFTLVRAFEFSLAVPADDIVAKSVMVRRSFVKSEMKKGAQMPLIVKPYNQ